MPPTVESVSRSDAGLASSLRVSVARLHRRLRTEDVDDLGVSVGGVAVIVAALPARASRAIGQLAAAERVQPPSMTRTVTCLERDGLRRRGTRTPPTAARSSSACPRPGEELLAAERRRRDAWLTRHLARAAPRRSVPLLRAAAPVLERLSNS